VSYDHLRRSLEELGFLRTTLSKCSECGNSDIDKFTYKGADEETGSEYIQCSVCKTFAEVQCTQTYFNDVDNRENLTSSSATDCENFDEEPEYDEDADREFFSHLQCENENCGNKNPDLWRQASCDLNDVFVECLGCERLYKIKHKFLYSEDYSASGYLDARVKKACEIKPRGGLSEAGWVHVSKLSSLKPGDHVAWHRIYAAYHHAIVEKVDVSNNRITVIEYSGGLTKLEGHIASVRRTILHHEKDDGDMMFKIVYEKGCELSNEETLRKAESRLGEAKYNPLTNNCEHFATWCKTGEAESEQATTIANRLKRAAIETSLKASEELAQAGAMTGRNIPMKQCFKIARNVGLKNAKIYGEGVRKLARNVKGSAIALNVGINLAIEGTCYVYHTQRAHKRYLAGKISREDFELQRMKLRCECLGGFAAGTFGGFVGQAAIPIPIVGAVIGSTLGNLIGRHVGAVIGKKVSENHWKVH